MCSSRNVFSFNVYTRVYIFYEHSVKAMDFFYNVNIFSLFYVVSIFMDHELQNRSAKPHALLSALNITHYKTKIEGYEKCV